MSAGEVVRVEGEFKLDVGDKYAQASCKHKKNGACGGCYARLAFALQEIEHNPREALATIARVYREMQADKRGPRPAPDSCGPSGERP